MRLICTKKSQIDYPIGPRTLILKKVVFLNWVTHWLSLSVQQCWLEY